MMHDCHEFLMHLMSNLQDEETPAEDSKFDGSDAKKTLE